MQPAVLLAISSTCNIVHLFLYRIEVLPLKPISNVDIRHCVLPLTNGVSKGAEDSKDYWSKISKNVCAALLLLQHGNVAYYVLHYSRARRRLFSYFSSPSQFRIAQLRWECPGFARSTLQHSPWQVTLNT